MVVVLAPTRLSLYSENGSTSRSCTSSPEVDLDADEEMQAIQCMWSCCGIWCPDSKTLTEHITETHMTRSNDRAFYCLWSTCLRQGKGFNARYKMIVHVRTHTREKPLQCKFCMKKYSRNENLKIHIRSHTGEKPYVCSKCGKAFSNSSDKFKHSRTHDEKKPYACKVLGCTKRYTDPSSLRKHVKTFKHELQRVCQPEHLSQLTPSESHLHPQTVSEPKKMDRRESVEMPFFTQTISRPVPQYVFVPVWNMCLPRTSLWTEAPLDLASTPLDLSCRVQSKDSR